GWPLPCPCMISASDVIRSSPRHVSFDNTKKSHHAGIALVLLWTAPFHRCSSATNRELVCVLRTTYENIMVIGSILVLVLGYIGVELVCMRLQKGICTTSRRRWTGELIYVKQHGPFQ
ncbi:MAG TPA: hypothetical protein VN089_12720, partial [Duganella sp.]|nr:hypothetical protein [Duganella sp.]